MWHILVVDDNFINRKLIVEILREKALCDVAANGAEAVTAFETSLKNGQPYDAVLMDIAMPDVDGIQALSRIRAIEKTGGGRAGEGIPVIMVTAYKAPFLDAFNQGCDDYLLKPIIADKLVQKIRDKVKPRA